MLKQLLSDKRILCGFICALVLVVTSLVYQGSVKRQVHRDIQRTEKIVKERQRQETGSQPTENGHYHSDGTYHTGSHETPSGMTAPSKEVERSGIAPESVIWTGKPLREVSAPDPLSPAERKARNAKIQALNTEIKQLVRATRAHMHKYNEQVDKYPKIRQEIKAISTELDTFPAAEDRTTEQQTRYDTLLKRYLELENLADEVLTIANEMREESRQLLENLDPLETELSALRRQ